MVKRTGTTNVNLKKLIADLKSLSTKEKVNIWKRIAQDLSRPTRIRRRVNLKQINRVVNDNDTIIVPGKVLSYGELDKKITIAAYQYSEGALEKLSKKAKVLSIRDIMKENPKGKRLRIIG